MKAKTAYRFLVGKQVFPNPEEVLAVLSQSFDEPFLWRRWWKKKKQIRKGKRKNKKKRQPKKLKIAAESSEVTLFQHRRMKPSDYTTPLTAVRERERRKTF